MSIGTDINPRAIFLAPVVAAAVLAGCLDTLGKSCEAKGHAPGTAAHAECVDAERRYTEYLHNRYRPSGP